MAEPSRARSRGPLCGVLAILLLPTSACRPSLPGMAIEQFANRFVCDLIAYEPGKPIE